jgi:hypothetical protein
MCRSLVRFIATLACLAAGTLTGCVDGNAMGIAPAATGSGMGLTINVNENPSTRYVTPGQTITLSVSVHNPGGGNVSYSWSATDGFLSSSSGRTVVWTAPSTPGDVNVQVTVSNGNEEAPGGYRFTVQ